MKPFIVIACLLLAVTAIQAAEPPDKFPNFALMDKDKAAAVARKQAEADFAAGHYRILVFGMRSTEGDKGFAKDGVEVKVIAGCVVNDGILDGARIYNEIMRAKLKAKLGRDIFAGKDPTESIPPK